MALVDDSKEILGEIVEKAEWTHARLAAVEVSGIVFDTTAMAYLAYHLNVVGGTLVKSCGLDLLGLATEELHLFAKVDLHFGDSLPYSFTRGNKDVGGEYLELVMLAERCSRLGMDGVDSLDLIAPEHYTQSDFLVCQTDVDRVAFDAEIASAEVNLIA